MRALSPVEAAVAVSILGSVMAVGGPAFFRNLQASRLVEPMEGLARLAGAALAGAEGKPPETAFPDEAPLTPAQVPAGEAVVDPPGTWSHPTWEALGFRFEQPHRYSFQFESERSKRRASFRASARGDLDADGQLSTFSVGGEASERGGLRRHELQMQREIE